MAKVFGRITVIKKNGRDGTKVPLLDNLCTIGRDSDCDIRIKLPTVSSKHCQLQVLDGKVVFTNLSGTNPSLVNNAAVMDTTFLNDEDIFTITTRSFRWEACKPEENEVEMSNKEQENQPETEPVKRSSRSSSASLTNVRGPTPVKTPKVTLKRASARNSSGIVKTPLSIKKSNRASFAKQHSNDENVEKIISSPDRMKTAALRTIHAAQLKNKNSLEAAKQVKGESSPPVSPNSNAESPGKHKTPGKVDTADSSFDFSTHKTPSVPTEMFVSPLQTPSSLEEQSNKQESDKDATLNGEVPSETSPTSSRKSSKTAVKRRSSRKADYTDVAGVKRLMKQSPVADYGNVSGVQKLMASPETGDSGEISERYDEPSRTASKRRSSSLRNQDSSLVVSEEEEEEETPETVVKRRSSLKGDYTNVVGVKRLMGKSPVPDYGNVSGVQGLMASPEAKCEVSGHGDEPTTPKSSSKRKLSSPSMADIGEKPETPVREAQVVLARISPQVIKQYSPRSPTGQLTNEENVSPPNSAERTTVIDESTGLPSDKTEEASVGKRKSSLNRCVEKYQSRKSQETPTARIVLSPVKVSPRRSILTDLQAESPMLEKPSRGSTPRILNQSGSLVAQKYVSGKTATPNKTFEISPSPQDGGVQTEAKPETVTPVQESQKAVRLSAVETPKPGRKSTPGSGHVTVRTLRSRIVSSVNKKGSLTGPGAKRRNVSAKKIKKVAMVKLTYSQVEEPEDVAVEDDAEVTISNEDNEMEVEDNVPVTSVKKKSAVKVRQTRSKKLADIDLSEFQEKSEVVEEDAASVVSSRMDDRDEDNVSEASSVTTTKRKRVVRGKTETVEPSMTSPIEKAAVGRTRRLATKSTKLEVKQEEDQMNDEPVTELQSVRKARMRKGKSPIAATTAVTKLVSRTRASRTPTARRSSSKSPGIRITRSRKQMAANR